MAFTSRSALANVMARAAEKAGKNLRRDFGEVENLQVSRKGPADFVSRADMQSQAILREELAKARPLFGFMMEEDDKAADSSQQAERWIVDPLDGTTNFLHGVPHWCVSIAAVRGTEVIAGLIYNPVVDEMFWAEKGLGAFFNNRRMRVSNRGDLSESLIATGLPFKGSKHAMPDSVDQLNAIMPQVSGIRRFGAAALDLAWVAAGRFDAYWETNVFPWDIAAGIVMVREAGGIVSPLTPGTDPALQGGGLLASNSALHDRLMELIRGVGQPAGRAVAHQGR